MTTFYNNKEDTQKLKAMLKPQTQNKLSDPKQKLTPSEGKTLPIRGQK
jgi:hypothetical protein